jgi:hypothetical protein
VIAEDDSFHLGIDGETVAVVPRTTTREIHRYKAHASPQPAQPAPGKAMITCPA